MGYNRYMDDYGCIWDIMWGYKKTGYLRLICSTAISGTDLLEDLPYISNLLFRAV
jgi:hypothetical protein